MNKQHCRVYSTGLLPAVCFTEVLRERHEQTPSGLLSEILPQGLRHTATAHHHSSPATEGSVFNNISCDYCYRMLRRQRINASIQTALTADSRPSLSLSEICKVTQIFLVKSVDFFMKFSMLFEICSILLD